MEPLFIRCETCHTRLRVRDERYLGQVQACPKCGSMVLIAAPVAAEVPAPAAATAEPAPSLLARVAEVFQANAVAFAAGGGTLLVLAGAWLTLSSKRGQADVVAIPAAAPIVAAVPKSELEQIAPAIAPVESTTAEIELRQPAQVIASAAPAPVTEQPPTESLPAELIETPTEAVATTMPPKPERTLTLEPAAPASENATSAAATGSYPTEVEVALEEEQELSSPQVAPRVTNVADRLELPIDAIDMPATTLGDFVGLVSSMSTVPISLDSGVSKHTKIAVRGADTTLGSLLDDVLREHNLASDERDGHLVIVEARRN